VQEMQRTIQLGTRGLAHGKGSLVQRWGRYAAPFFTFSADNPFFAVRYTRSAKFTLNRRASPSPYQPVDRFNEISDYQKLLTENSDGKSADFSDGRAGKISVFFHFEAGCIPCIVSQGVF